jgi:hypothetical protein
MQCSGGLLHIGKFYFSSVTTGSASLPSYHPALFGHDQEKTSDSYMDNNVGENQHPTREASSRLMIGLVLGGYQVRQCHYDEGSSLVSM